MSMPGGKKDSQSFGEVHVNNKSHEVTKRPAMGMYKGCTMAEYANIEHGEEVAPVRHIHHAK